MAPLRLFVAVPLPPPVETEIGGVLLKVNKNREIRWVTKHQLHVTLRFIGDLEEGLVSNLESRLSEVSLSIPPFEMGMGGLGAFPNINHPRVLFIPITHGEGPFRELEKRISASLVEMGIQPEEKEYHPHLTLGRVREKQDARPAVQALRDVLPGDWGHLKVDRFILFRSRLTSEGSIYTRLKEFEFGANR